MDLYAAPTAEPSGSRGVRRPRGAWVVRLFAAFHGAAVPICLGSCISFGSDGVRCLRERADPETFRRLAHPELVARSLAIRAAGELTLASILALMVVIGARLAWGLWRFRPWSRRLAMVQVALLFVVGGVVELIVAGLNDWRWGGVRSEVFGPATLLGAVTLVLWLPRFGAIFATGPASLDRR